MKWDSMDKNQIKTINGPSQKLMAQMKRLKKEGSIFGLNNPNDLHMGQETHPTLLLLQRSFTLQ